MAISVQRYGISNHLMRADRHWSLNFLDDRIVSGRRFQVLNIADDVTPQGPGDGAG